MYVPVIGNIMKQQASQKLKINANQRRSLGLLAVFALISVLVLMPNESVSHDMGCVASELMVKETIEGNVISTSTLMVKLLKPLTLGMQQRKERMMRMEI